MATTVTYKGATLTTVDNATKVLETAGTWMEDDLTLVDVSGGGTKPNIDIGVTNTPIVNIMNMFYELEHGTAKTGTFTPVSAFPNTSTLVFSTGLATVHGLFIADESQATLNTTNTPENTLIAFVANPTSEGSGDYAFTRYTNNMEYNTNTPGVMRGFLNRCTWGVSGGDLYITCSFNANDSYTPFHSGHTYRWVAWGV